MIIEYIDGQLLRKMIVEGAQSLEKNKQMVNALNVFPVPDGDTGTNMSLTMQSAVREVNNVKNCTVENIANALANGSLMGARGNSGVILSQLFRGFAKGVAGKEQLSVEDLAKALKLGSDTAYKAVMKPVEGTILTVARESAEKSLELANAEQDIVSFIEKVIAQAEDTLKRTPDMLKVLKDAGVVDSGGKGLIFIYQGALAAITGKESEIYTYENTVEAIHVEEEHVIGDLQFGYCTEFILHAKNANIDKFRDRIKDYGDSVLVVGNEEIIKVHIHTNHPGEVMEKAIKLGYLADIKIDNMNLQHRHEIFDEEAEAKREPKKQYGFVTVTMGEGLTKIFNDFGVDYVIEGGQTMNPSTEDFIKAIEQIDAKHIYIFPNNSNIIMAANQAKAISDKAITVIPTKSVPQGISALLAFNEDFTPENNEKDMLEAMGNVKTGQVTYAVRDTSFNDIQISIGDILGIGNGEIKAVGKEIAKVSTELLNNLVGEDDEIISVFFGEEVQEATAAELVESLQKQFPDCEIEMYYGGQPLYYYIFAVE